MINHPYFTPFVTFVLALAIGLYLQLHLHIIPDLSIKDPDSFISTNSGQEDDDSSTSKSSSHFQQQKNKNKNHNNNNDQSGIDASGWNQWHHIRHWPDEGALWPSPRHSHAATSAIFDHEEMMFVFGGLYGNNNDEKNQNENDGNNNNLPGKILGDLWRYDEFHDRWYPVVAVPKKGESEKSLLQPAPRFDASLLSFDNGHKLVLTGGYNFGNDNGENDHSAAKAVPVNDGVWIFDIAKNSWSVVANNNNNDDAPSSCVPTSKNTFIIGNDLHVLCIDDEHQRLLKKFSLSTTKPSSWKKVPVDFAPLPSTATTKQQSSSSSSLLLTKLSKTEILFFIDGKEWILDFSSEENHQPQFLRLSTIPPSPSSSPSSQSNTCITTIKNRVFVFGGITSMINDDFHVLNLETKTWKKITKGSFGRSTRPPPTFGHSCVRIRDDKIVMVGGRTSVDSPGTSDVWEFWFSETDVNGIY